MDGESRLPGLNELLLIIALLLFSVALSANVLLFTGLVTLIPAESPINLTEGLTAFDAGAGTILSAFLVFLYYQQKEILDQQREINKTELSGLLRIEDVDYDGEYIELWLSNYSKSGISDLKLNTEAFPENDTEATFSVGSEKMEREDGSYIGVSRTNTIGANQKMVKFRANPHVMEQNDGENPMKHSLSFLIHRFEDIYGTEEFTCRMWVSGTDKLGEDVKRRVFTHDKHVIMDRFNDREDLRGVFKAAGIASIPDDQSSFVEEGA